LATTQTQPAESAAICGTDSCTESIAKGSQRQEPIRDIESAVWQILAAESDASPMGKFWPSESDCIPMGKFWHQNQTASQWANSGFRIGRHPNGQILAPESDAIPMGKFWHQNLLEHPLELFVLGLLPPPLILSS
jgi:hypothetical protein